MRASRASVPQYKKHFSHFNVYYPLVLKSPSNGVIQHAIETSYIT